MYSIYEKKSLGKVIRKSPKAVIKHYELWKKIMELEGPKGIKQVKGFHDEALKGDWKGFRSSRLSLKWRVIYQINKGQCEVYVIDINPHTY